MARPVNEQDLPPMSEATARQVYEYFRRDTHCTRVQLQWLRVRLRRYARMADVEQEKAMERL